MNIWLGAVRCAPPRTDICTGLEPCAAQKERGTGTERGTKLRSSRPQLFYTGRGKPLEEGLDQTAEPFRTQAQVPSRSTGEGTPGRNHT